MGPWTLVLLQLSALAGPLWAQGADPDGAISPQDCSLDCIQQGGPSCEYCRITRSDVKKALGFSSLQAFGNCVPWPCFELLRDPKICRHYVQAPNEVKVEFVNEPNPKSDTVVVSWKPSYYGIAFLRGFQVSLQALGGTGVACQLFLFHRNVSLPASHAQRVYTSDPFPGLALGTQYAVTVMALPVPEKWEKFYHSEIFSTRSCTEKNGLEQCKKDWYPKHIEVQQEGSAVTVTFNLAPPNLGISSYFSLCYANGMKKYTDITPNSTKNKTHHSYHLDDLQEGTNYTCEIAANEVDAVRKTFSVQVLRIHKGGVPLSTTPSLAVVLPLCLAVVAILGVLLVVFARRRSKLRMKKLDIKPGAKTNPATVLTHIIKQHEESRTQEEMVLLARNRLKPPRLLICYSSCDGPAHINAVMKLGAFIQQHMATQVCLDLWDSLSVAQEGSMAWHCRHIRECDFILVICSWGLNQKPEPPEPEWDGEDEEAERELDFGSDAAVKLIGEEVCRAKARGQDLSKYMAAIFKYSEETDIPTELRLVSHYTLTNDLALLFSHLHGVALHRPGGYLKISHISEESYANVPAGAALQWAIDEAAMEMRAKQQNSVEEGN
ncbi:interleukin-17 receptor D isoform X1 [Stegastes partitus]|uniref:Interleukin-17 receptor D isoform X1 n=1 Tax=Stegastes partitus TaxID=144197 RepID=A0A9Y4NLI9_9TELE|nr:PREDICTED: interleukin-17 receptor D-like isoform X1 [Stegastes partitus]